MYILFVLIKETYNIPIVKGTVAPVWHGITVEHFPIRSVTDIGTRVCVDPGGNGAIMNMEGGGGAAHLAGEEMSSW